MPTANFNLPLIDGASPISIVNDMNSLATAADSAMATLATASDIASIKQTADNAEAQATKAISAAAAAQGTANTANTAATTANVKATQAADDAANAVEKSTLAQNGVEALNTVFSQTSDADKYYYGASGYHIASATGVTYTDWHWDWCNGTLRFGGRETVSGTLPSDCITLPAGAAKPFLPTGATGTVILGYGSIGNDSGRNLCEVRYNTNTEVLSVYTAYLRTSSTPVFLDITVNCGMDLSKI